MPTPTIYDYDKETFFSSGISSVGLHKEIAEASGVSIQIESVSDDGATVFIAFQDDLEAQTPDQLPTLEALLPLHDPTYVGPNDPQHILIDDINGTTAYSPVTSGNTPIFQLNVIPPGYLFYGTGVFDGAISRGDGASIAGSWTDAGDYVITGRFLEHVYIHGGHIYVKNGGPLDYVSMTLVSPGAILTPTAGNVTLSPYGPGNVVLPFPGTHTLDYTTKTLEYCANVAPVPTPGTGYWNWDENGVTPAPAGDGGYSIFDFDIQLGRQANRYPLLGGGDVTPAAAVKGKKILPHWLWVFDVHKELTTVAALELAVRLDTSRKTTL